MNIRKKTGGVCLLIAMTVAGCLWFLPDGKEAVEGSIIENDPYFRIVETGEGKYLYTIYNTRGEKVREEERFREPRISYIDQETIEIFGSAGTAVWHCVYYDIVHDRFSEPFVSPVAAKYQEVAFPERRGDETVLVIRDMFDADNCYQEFPLDFGEVAFPVVSAEFKSDDHLLITYKSGEFYGDKEKTKILTWGEGALRKNEKTANSETDIKGEKEPQRIIIERTRDWIRCEHHLYRDILHDEYSPEEIPFVDDKGFALIWEAYAGVEYAAEFAEGDPAVYEAYKQKFGRLILNKVPFVDKETGKEVTLKDWGDLLEPIVDYCFFDVNGDGLPELYINGYLRDLVIAYDPDQEQFISWKLLENMRIIGTRKAEIVYEDIGSSIFSYVELDADGNVELDTMFFSQPEDLFHYAVGDPKVNMVMLPNYADREKQCEITEEMKRQGIFEAGSRQWFFRITDDQFAQLEKRYSEGLKEVWEERRKVTYTYEELLGVDYVDDELYDEIKEIYQEIDFSAVFHPGDVTKYDLYKEKYKKFINGEATVWIKETEKEEYIYDMYGLEDFRTAIELGEYDIDWYRYHFFDINGDKDPELCIQNKFGYIYVFQYNEERDQIELWKEYISNTISLMGTQKLKFGAWEEEGMISLDENGDRIFFVHFQTRGGAPYRNEQGDYGYLVFLPEYIEFTDEMREQAIYDVVNDEYCFRVTEEQFEELTKDYDEACKASYDALDEVTYTYAELFECSLP